MALGRGMKSILRNGGLMVGSGWVEIASRLIYIVFVTRYLGAQDYGVWTYAMAAYGLVIGLSTLGLETLIPVRMHQTADRVQEILSTALCLRLVTLLVAGMGLILFAMLAEEDWS
ncbi:MAG: oligosaccharide flippase family protein, partial [Pseudomonadota bacterium]